MNTVATYLDTRSPPMLLRRAIVLWLLFMVTALLFVVVVLSLGAETPQNCGPFTIGVSAIGGCDRIPPDSISAPGDMLP
jgi:hypothetical protein